MSYCCVQSAILLDMHTSKSGFLKPSPKLMIFLAEKRVNQMIKYRRKQRPLYKQEGVVFYVAADGFSESREFENG